jgi:hypothetical protein
VAKVLCNLFWKSGVSFSCTIHALSWAVSLTHKWLDQRTCKCPFHFLFSALNHNLQPADS